MMSFRRSPFPALGLFVALAALSVALLGPVAEAADVFLTADDATNAATTSFNGAGNWSNLSAPSGGNDYFTQGFRLRTPNTGGSKTFLGGSLTVNSSGIFHYAGSNSQTITVDNFILAGGQVASGINNNMTLAGNITLTANTSSSFNVTSNATARNFIVNAPISGSGSLSFFGNNGYTALVSANNTFTGSVFVGTGATLRLDNVAALRNSALDTTGLGVVSLNAGSGAYTIGGLSGSTNLSSVITTNLGNMTTLVLNPQSGSQSYSGNIANGAMNLTKNGTGTQILSGALSYTGATTVNAGTLVIDGSTSASSAVTIGLSGALGGNGTIGGAVTVDGLLSPGTSPGIMSFSSGLTLNGTALFEIDGVTTRGTDYDGVNTGAGLLTYGGGLTFDIGTTLSGNHSFDLFQIGGGGQTGNFTSVNVTGNYTGTLFDIGSGVWQGADGGGNTWSFSQATGDLQFVAVPEPATLMLLGAGVATAGLSLVRRRKK
jgi:autotransporter-associated beta strand protein